MVEHCMRFIKINTRHELLAYNIELGESLSKNTSNLSVKMEILYFWKFLVFGSLKKFIDEMIFSMMDFP